MVKYREINYYEGDCEKCGKKDVEVFYTYGRYMFKAMYCCSSCKQNLEEI